MIYNCFRCGYNTNHKGHFTNHLNRKKICKPILEDISIYEIKKHYNIVMNQNDTQMTPKQHPNDTQTTPKQHPNDTQMTPKVCTRKCKYCSKIFTRKSGLTKHLNICIVKKESEILVISQKEEIEKMKLEIEELKTQTKSITTNSSNSNNNSNNNTTISNSNINNSKNIIINNYGDENLKHLRTKDFADILSTKYMCVPNLIEKIHFDSEHPENQNIKITNKKEPYLKIMKNNKWQFVNKKNELLNLIDDKCFLLKEKYYKILEKKKYKLSEHQKEKIEEFMEKYKEDDKQVMLSLIEETELMLLNNT